MIDTRRFVLRDFAAADTAGFSAYHADPRYRALFGSAEAENGSPEQLLARFAEWARERPRRNYQLAIARRESDTLIGCGGLRLASANATTAELGVELAPDHWGRFGYAIEISLALIDFGFRNLGLSEIAGATQSANARVIRLAESLGATLSANRPGPDWMRAKGWTEIEWRVRREAWEIGRAARRFARL